MNRVIKFRAWHKANKEMLYEGWNNNRFTTLPQIMNYGEDVELMQFTGLYDASNWDDMTLEEQAAWIQHSKAAEWKGKPIYAGDVFLNGEIYYEVFIGEVLGTVNSYYGVGMRNKISKRENRGTYLPLEMLERIKIIGNIFENPENTQP